MSDRDESESVGLDIDSPNPARMYDYFLGGSANFAVDREAAQEQIERVPDTLVWARANRSFLGRAVRYLVDQGIGQFLDLGSGVPTVGNVHEIAHRERPHARVAYVDHEPVAVAHARRLLGDDEQWSAVIQADIRYPSEVLSAPGVAGLLDFSRPVAVLAVSVLSFLRDEENPADVVAAYRDACVPGSALALSHVSAVSLDDSERADTEHRYRRASTPGRFRTREEIATLFSGYRLVEPGLVLLDEWHPEWPVDLASARRANSYGAVGLLPFRDQSR